MWIGNNAQRWRAFEIAWGRIGEAVWFRHTCPDGRAPWSPRPKRRLTARQNGGKP